MCCFPCCECASYVVEWNVIWEACPLFKPYLASNLLTLPLLPLWTKHLLSISKLMQNLQRSYSDNQNISHPFNFYNNHFYFYNNPYHNHLQSNYSDIHIIIIIIFYHITVNLLLKFKKHLSALVFSSFLTKNDNKI